MEQVLIWSQAEGVTVTLFRGGEFNVVVEGYRFQQFTAIVAGDAQVFFEQRRGRDVARGIETGEVSKEGGKGLEVRVAAETEREQAGYRPA